MRIRTVKPSLWTSEDMAELSDAALLLAIGLLNFADDEGYFSANVALIRAAIFPLRKTPGLDALIAELVQVRYVELATGTDGRRYGRICKFLDHQRINRPSESVIAAMWPREEALTEDSVNAHGALAEASSPERKGMEEERKQERKEALARAAAVEAGFERFWQAYPRKDARAEARKAFEKVDVDVAVLLKALEWQRRQESWVKDGGQFIPHAATWLNKRRWEDEPRLNLPATSPARQAANDGRHYPGPQKARVVSIPEDV
jgi:hypothetical protein